MNALVIDASQEEPLPAYRRRLSALVKRAPRMGWGYDPFSRFSDLVPSIDVANGSSAGRIIEIVAHGAPEHHHNIGGSGLAAFANTLRTVLPSRGHATVYLTGCNTGLTEAGYCIAEQLALALGGVTVCGAAGFIMEGAAITGDVITAATVDHVSYDHARDDQHPGCWNCFRFPNVARPSRSLRTIRPALIPTPEIEPDALRQAIAETLAEARPRALPPLLIGADVRGTVDLADGAFAYEILLRGAVLRDLKTRQTFHFERGPELLQRFLR